jgi:(+)-trans-carveol dehydrogenase
MPGKLEGQVALVTGAARGQGRSHALRLAREGADIIAVDICQQIETTPYPMASSDDLKETVRQVEELDRRVVAHIADVRDYTALESAVADGVAQLGRLDIVLANAGIVSLALVPDLTQAQWNDMIGTNLTGVFHTMQIGARHIIAGGRGGSIIATSSIVALKPVAACAHYIAAKAGVIGLVKAFAVELAEHNIRVNSIHPTNCDTDMIQNPALRKAFLPDSPNPTREESEPVYQSLNSLPIPWIQPQDTSNAIAFLVSEEGRYITGVQFPVDAGFLLK